MWGQATSAFFVVAIPRIIPTRVGTRKTSITTRRKRWDHPHACGDKISLRSAYGRSLGSSPRVWGQAVAFGVRKCFSDIIPTRVGTSAYAASISSCVEDHPHACGDKLSDTRSDRRSRGSSPRVWGQEGRPVFNCVGKRIIPTRVGTRKTTHADTRTDEDHPHACGDKTTMFTSMEQDEGSSPRVWGQAIALISVSLS